MPKTLARLTIESIGPISLGGYDTRVKRTIGPVTITEAFRLGSLKGVWRWWTRAYIAGAAWDLSLNEVDEATRRVNELLGSTERASKFGLRLADPPIVTDSKYDDFRRAKRIPRIGLLLMGRRGRQREEVYYRTFYRGLRAELEVYERKQISSTKRKLAFGSLITALKLGGIGKASRRGFGSFSVKIDNTHQDIEDLVKFSREIETGEFNCIKKGLEGLIKKTYEEAKSLVREGRKGLTTAKSLSQRGPLPQIPSISINANAFSLYLLSSSEVPADQLLFQIGRSTLRIEGGSIVAHLIGVGGKPRDPAEKPLAWLLGLPRRYRRRTGYLCVERRASPLLFSLISRNIASVTLIMSLDWPERLKWKGRMEKIITFDEKRGLIFINKEQFNLFDVMNRIKELLKNYFNRLGWRVEEVKVF